VALPDFFIAGAPKAGTTALHAALARHPDLYLSSVKEPKFFLTDGPPPAQGGPGDAKTYREHVWRRPEYEALFAPAPAGTIRGESTPFYLYNLAAQQRIHKLVPQARMIIVLRDPIERAHSNWTHLWSAGLDPIDDFVRACDAEDRRVAAGWADFWHYKRIGLYGAQLDHLHTVFPAEQVLLLRYRDLVDNPAGALDRICAFLGIRPGLIAEIPRENVTAHPDQTLRHQYLSRVLRTGSAVTTRLPGHPARALIDRLESSLQRGAAPRRPLTWQQRQALIPYFEADVRLLENLTGQDFSGWLRPRQDSGGRVGARPAGQRQARNGRPRAF
jgi:Sulfotransferase family